MRSAVRFAAWMPAIRATPSTSPFGSACFFSSRIVPARQSSRPRAVARRKTISLRPTSTIRAVPFPSRWLNFFFVVMNRSGGKDTPRPPRRKPRRPGRNSDQPVRRRQARDVAGTSPRQRARLHPALAESGPHRPPGLAAVHRLLQRLGEQDRNNRARLAPQQARQRDPHEKMEADEMGERVAGQPENQPPRRAPENKRLARADVDLAEMNLRPERPEKLRGEIVLAPARAARNQDQVAGLRFFRRRSSIIVSSRSGAWTWIVSPPHSRQRAEIRNALLLRICPAPSGWPGGTISSPVVRCRMRGARDTSTEAFPAEARTATAAALSARPGSSRISPARASSPRCRTCRASLRLRWRMPGRFRLHVLLHDHPQSRPRQARTGENADRLAPLQLRVNRLPGANLPDDAPRFALVVQPDRVAVHGGTVERRHVLRRGDRLAQDPPVRPLQRHRLRRQRPGPTANLFPGLCDRDHATRFQIGTSRLSSSMNSCRKRKPSRRWRDWTPT